MKPQRNSPRPNSNHIPEDLLHEVLLPRLSFKTLSRVKGVSKACHAIITSSARFSTLQSMRPTPASTGFVYADRRGLSFLPNQTDIGVPDPSLKFLVESPEDVRLLSSSNGLLLVYLYGGVNSLCICNPATMKTEIVPNTPKRIFRQMALAFNPHVAPSRYAIVDAQWGFKFNGDIRYTFNVFRSETGKWDRSEQKVFVSGSSYVPTKPVHAQGVFYWCCIDYVLWYNLEKDCAGTIPLPYSKEEEIANKKVSAINDEIFCMCVTIEAALEVWKLTSRARGAEWERLYKVTMEKLIDVSPQKLYLGLRCDEGAGESHIVRHFVRLLAFDGQSLYMAVNSKIWHRGKDLMNDMKEYPPDMENYMISLLEDQAASSLFDVYIDGDGESEPELDLLSCDVISGELINIGSTIPIDDNCQLHHYHNSLAAIPQVQSPNR